MSSHGTLKLKYGHMNTLFEPWEVYCLETDKIFKTIEVLSLHSLGSHSNDKTMIKSENNLMTICSKHNTHFHLSAKTIVHLTAILNCWPDVKHLTLIGLSHFASKAADDAITNQFEKLKILTLNTSNSKVIKHFYRARLTGLEIEVEQKESDDVYIVAMNALLKSQHMLSYLKIKGSNP